MSTWGWIYLLLLGIHVGMCLAWKPSGTVLYRSHVGEGCGIAMLERRGLLLLNLTPFGASFLCLLDGHLKAGEVRRLHQAVLGHTRMLRAACATLFTQLFLLVPLVFLLKIPAPLPWLVLAGLANLVLVWVSLWRAHRRLHPDRKAERLTLLFFSVVSPVDAVHAGDALLRKALEGFHPLALARVLCTEQAYLACAQRQLRQARFPFSEEDWIRLSRFVREEGGDPEVLTGPPQSRGGTRTFCPRCAQQYVLETGVCADCRGISLVKLISSPDGAGHAASRTADKGRDL